ncbi:MAG: NAD(P)H-hydrate dehydratase [bacterium]
MKLYYSENLKQIDSKTYSDFGYSEAILMENAGSACFREFVKIYNNDLKCDSIISVICGKGNNGGDGFVFSRYLFNAGYNVKTVIMADPDNYAGISKLNLEILIKLNAEIIPVIKEDDISILSNLLDKTDILADAVFGIGINREITGFYKNVIETVESKSNYDVLCIDNPSGFNADSGFYMGTGIKNNIKKIFTFGGLKVGFYLNEGDKLNLHDKTILIDINQPRHLLEKYYSNIEILDEKKIAAFLPERMPFNTKFDYGHVLVIAGSPGKTGAAYMSSLSAFKAGAGLVTLAVPSELNQILEIKTSEVMTYPVINDGSGYFNINGVDDIAKNLLKNKTAVVIGPGLGLKKQTADFLYNILEVIEVPIIIDADGLNLISEDMNFFKKLTAKKKNIILTPHYKEMERLTKIDRKIIEKDPIKIGSEFVKEYGVYLLLKDSSMFVFNNNAKDKAIQYKHSSLLASGGSGDVLSGLTGSFAAQGIDLFKSMCLSSYLLVYSANNLRCKFGESGAGAVEIALNIPHSMNLLKSCNLE